MKNLTGKKILVTGGAGFIGSELIRQLINAKSDVTVFDNFQFGSRKNVPSKLRLVKGDLRSPKDIRRVFNKSYDLVFHLAAVHFIPYCNSHPRETISINIEGTQALLEILHRVPPRGLFFASTAAVYDTSSRLHRENETPSPTDIYGMSKLAGEFLVRQFHNDSGVPCVMGRLSNAYGPRETNPHLIPEIVNQLKKKRGILRLGNLSPYRDFIHTADLARAMILLMLQARAGVSLVNIASGKEYSVREVVRIFSQHLQKKLVVRSVTNRRRRTERLHLRSDLRVLQKLTGFKPKISFASGIEALLQSERLVSK